MGHKEKEDMEKLCHDSRTYTHLEECGGLYSWNCRLNHHVSFSKY
jgi:hypothetical protein